MNIGKYLLFTLLVLTTASCKKDEEEVVIKDFTIEALTVKSWRHVLVDGNTSVNPLLGTYQYYAVQNWDKDDVITFKTDSKVYYNYGSVVAPISIEMPDSKTYSVDLSKKTITIQGVIYQLLELSATRLKYSLTLGGGNPTLIFMFEHP